MPRARATTATAAKPGFLASIRKPYRRSWISIRIEQPPASLISTGDAGAMFLDSGFAARYSVTIGQW
jgi:hypothetical protein